MVVQRGLQLVGDDGHHHSGGAIVHVVELNAAAGTGRKFGLGRRDLRRLFLFALPFEFAYDVRKQIDKAHQYREHHQNEAKSDQSVQEAFGDRKAFGLNGFGKNQRHNSVLHLFDRVRYLLLLTLLAISEETLRNLREGNVGKHVFVVFGNAGELRLGLFRLLLLPIC